MRGTAQATGRNMTLEIRLHGRGGQGGVTCAKILATLYARLGKSVQAFGDYAGERSGAPVRAYTRVDDRPVTNRNKVYRPDHVLVLDPSLLDADAVQGLAPGGLLLVNTNEPLRALEQRFPAFRVAVLDATGIARRHEIGSRSVVIVNTTIAGAYARALDLPFHVLDATYRDLHLEGNLAAAREAFESVSLGTLRLAGASHSNGAAPAPGPAVLELTRHVAGAPTGLRTGSWRTQAPRYVEALAPCNASCPAGNDVVGFVQALAHGNVEEAAAILARTQPLAAVCGRVCPAPCMEGCNRREYDGAVNIRALERWVGDHAPARAFERAPRTGKRVAIVGSGPAGLAAAWDLARAGHGVAIFEGESDLGGVLRTGIPAYRLPREILDREIDRIRALGVVIRTGEFVGPSAIAFLSERYEAVIVAAGFAQTSTLRAPGVDLPGIQEGTRFLHRVNLESGERLSGHVLILGGGNTAMDCARSALRSGAARVTVAYRRGRSEMPAIAEEIEEARREGVAFLFQRQAVAFHGNGRVTAAELAEVELGEPDEGGRRRPVVTDRTSEVSCDHVLLAVGQTVDAGLLPIRFTVENGRLRTADGTTNIFLAGDFHTGEGTVAHAIGDGRRAAGRVRAALGETVSVVQRPDRAAAVPVSRIRVAAFESVPQAHETELSMVDRIHSFVETNLGLEAPSEAARCFSCGHCTQCDTCMVYCPEGVIRRIGPDYEADMNFCKGCGICVSECPRGAIEMVSA
jgi:2-oxoacid:acceptor oxidoreductase gamma subunit (pyruvate/2-ketoisovalerate family)